MDGSQTEGIGQNDLGCRELYTSRFVRQTTGKSALIDEIQQKGHALRGISAPDRLEQVHHRILVSLYLFEEAVTEGRMALAQAGNLAVGQNANRGVGHCFCAEIDTVPARRYYAKTVPAHGKPGNLPAIVVKQVVEVNPA